MEVVRLFMVHNGQNDRRWSGPCCNGVVPDDIRQLSRQLELADAAGSVNPTSTVSLIKEITKDICQLCSQP